MAKYIFPFPAGTYVSQNYGLWPGGFNPWGGHTGKDFGVPIGTPIYAACDGVIAFEGWTTGQYYENPWWFVAGTIAVVLDETGPAQASFTYGHMDSTVVSKGDLVKQGQIIGYSGNTGQSSGPHCHFEYLPNNWDYQNGTFGRLNPDSVCVYWDGTSSLQPAGTVVTKPTTPEEDVTHWAIDISNHQGDINIAAINPDRVIIRASEGVGLADAWVEANVRKARNAGKAVDFYHYSHIGELDGNTPRAEADYYLSVIRRFWQPGDHVILDWEARYSQLWNGQAAREWMDIVLASLGAGPEAAIFYSYLNILTTNHDGLAPYREKYNQLWLAYYATESLNVWGDPEVTYGKPPVPAGWDLWGWQYTQYGRVPGYNGNLDLNIIYGGNDTMAITDDDIRKILNFQAFTPAPGEEPVSISLALKYATEVYRGLYKGGESTPDKDSLITFLVKMSKAVNGTVNTTAVDNLTKQLNVLVGRKQGATPDEVKNLLEAHLGKGGVTPGASPALDAEYELILKKVDKP